MSVSPKNRGRILKILITKSQPPGPPGLWVTLIWSISVADARRPSLGFVRERAWRCLSGWVQLTPVSCQERNLWISAPSPSLLPPRIYPHQLWEANAASHLWKFLAFIVIFLYQRRGGDDAGLSNWSWSCLQGPSVSWCRTAQPQSPAQSHPGPRETVNRTQRERWFWDPGTLCPMGHPTQRWPWSFPAIFRWQDSTQTHLGDQLLCRAWVRWYPASVCFRGQNLQTYFVTRMEKQS